MKIYLAGSIAGGREFESGIKLIDKALEGLGHTVLSKFVVDPEVNAARFPDLTGQERARAMLEEDLDLVTKCDVLVVEVSTPSHGVGVEMGWALGLVRLAKQKKPMLFLKASSLKAGRNSSLVFGNPYATFKYYDEKNVRKIVKEFLKRNE